MKHKANRRYLPSDWLAGLIKSAAVQLVAFLNLDHLRCLLAGRSVAARRSYLLHAFVCELRVLHHSANSQFNTISAITARTGVNERLIRAVCVSRRKQPLRPSQDIHLALWPPHIYLGT